MAARSRQLSELQDHRRSWQTFIQAQEAVIRHRERPLKIRLPEDENFSGGELRLEIIPVDNKTQFYEQAKSLLGVRETDIDIRQGLFSLSWDTTVSPSILSNLAETAVKYYFTYRPEPVVQGTVRRRSSDDPLAVKRQVELSLGQADLALPFQIACAEATDDHQTKIEIRLLIAPEAPNVTTFERNLSRWARAEAALTLRRTMANAGFAWRGVNVVMCATGEPDKPWLLKAKDYGDAMLIAHLEGLKRKTVVQVRDVLYCFRTTSVDKTAQAACLELLVDRLKSAFPTVELNLDTDRRRLEFTYYLSFAKRVTENLRLQNLLDSCRLDLERAHLQLLLSPQDRLLFQAREEPQRFKEDETERLRQLRGEEVNIGEGPERLLLGEIVRVSYPFIHITLPPDTTVEQRAHMLVRLKTSGEIRPNLTGDREKLARLSGALRRVADPKEKLLNPQTRWALFDATAAGGAADPNELKSGSSTWQEVDTHSYLSLNPAQHAAVVASLLARDLALVQGPPGTGKSTAISQIIWHLVRQDPQRRVLLTSETNTAVDNAIEKLEHSIHNLVKPVRIGDESKLEREGARYALTRLTAWVETPTADLTEEQHDNALPRWLRNITRRARTQAPADVPAALHDAWAAALASPSSATRVKVLNQYLTYTNVIGATGGALGEKTTLGKPTKFYRQYQQVFGSGLCATDKAVQQFRKAAKVAEPEPSPLGPHPADEPAPKGIRFDVVVMDEASKATPPELALAMIYAHRAIIIGDHRQLPPLLDQEEFRNTLIEAGEPELARQFSRADAETSQFERLFTQPGVQPGVVSRFDTQYRMHPDINAVIEQFYISDGGLKCGVPEALADVPDLTHPLSRYHGLSHSALLAATDHLVWVEVDAPEMLAGTSRVNLAEAQAVRAVLACLSESKGFAEFQAHWPKPEEQEVALITFYGRQVKLLQDVAAQFADRLPARVQTVDKFQGMERNIVVVSLVRSDKLAHSSAQAPDIDTYPNSGGYPSQPSLGFAQFPNRLNVALSRAKRLLIIVGNSRHFSRNDCYRRVYETVQARGRVVPYTALLPYLPA
ncbi:DEAD/DEAH box helicase [Hymenobacter sp. BT559]|uniref:DEAD/DEAH box helicase n=1 Tax=Hymenobacter sp. BT559 TaxID=2795729 RepID=UPI0018EA86AB|nr:AAA domain-containing protein [Hymenobacter sp. BT559]MBJ6146314.1 AAA family ATPase [Hymenobacter sp. BT559]